MFEKYSDQALPSGNNATIVPAEPGARIAFRLRQLAMQDVDVRVPMTGIASPIFRAAEQAVRATREKNEETGLTSPTSSSLRKHIAKEWPTLAIELQAMADRFPTLSTRVVETDNTDTLLKAFGVAISKDPGTPPVLKPQHHCLLELNATMNRKQLSAACPSHALHSYDLLSVHANNIHTRWFSPDKPGPVKAEDADADMVVRGGCADLDKYTLDLISTLCFLRFATAISSHEFVTSVAANRDARTLAASQALTSLAALVAGLSLQPALARIHSLVGFITSDLAMDTLRDEEGIRLRAALLSKYAAVEPIDLLGVGAELRSFFKPKTIKIVGTGFAQYNLPPMLYEAIRKVLDGVSAEETRDQNSIPSFSTLNPGVWAIDATDEFRVKSKLFDIDYVRGREPVAKANETFADQVHGAIQAATKLIDTITASDIVAAIPGGLKSMQQALTILPSASPLIRIADWTPNNPDDEAPVVVSGPDASLGNSLDPADLKKRPIVPPVTGGISETDLAALAGMYITGLPKRIEGLNGQKVEYDASKAVTPILIQTSPNAAKGGWPLIESPGFYQLWAHCYAPHTPRPLNTLNLPSLTALISELPSYASLNILRRDTPPDMEQRKLESKVVFESKVATALCRIGAVVSLSEGNPNKEVAGKPAAFADELFKRLEAEAGTAAASLSIARPTPGFGFAASRYDGQWPDSAPALRPWVRHVSPRQLDSLAVELSTDGSWWFVPFTHVPPPLPFDVRKMHFSLSAIDDQPGRGVDIDQYRIIGRSGYMAHLATEDGSPTPADQGVKTTKHLRPANNKPWKPVIPVWGGAKPDGKELDKWWPVGGIVHLDADVRTCWPFVLRAGVRDSVDRHLLFERRENAQFKPRASVPTGSIIMTDEPPTTLSRFGLASMVGKAAVQVAPTDWIPGYTDPSKVVTVNIL